MQDSLATTNPAASPAGQYLSFTLGGEHYGVNILKVREIRGWEEVRTLPDTPAFVKGVLDLRGSIVPIVDLRLRFKLKSAEYTPTTVVIVLALRLDGENRNMGIVVDAVSDVLDVKSGEIHRAPSLGARIDKAYIEGMVTRGKNMVIFLDADKLLNIGDLDNLPLPADQD